MLGLLYCIAAKLQYRTEKQFPAHNEYVICSYCHSRSYALSLGQAAVYLKNEMWNDFL